ncbi:MAG: hypothetical protein FWF92_05145 [Oscillospiraceae bacterium]|nr:hypothetical protein [Oscillospiraceae bacterium]
MIIKKLKMINYMNKRNKTIKFQKSEEKYTSLIAMKKARQLLWKIKSHQLPLLQNATYCYSFIWTSEKSSENKKFYVIDIFDDITYARILEEPSKIYNLPQYKDKIPYTKLYNNINRVVKNFINSGKNIICESR